ncbi:MAG: hypothetical protein ACREM3_12720 [Candidatus Rokuibacteriota bacterium]
MILRLVLVAGLAAGCAGSLREAPVPAAAEVGRVEFEVANEGYIVASFPSGSRMIAMDRFQMSRYVPGDEIRIDSFGRPLPR